MSLIRDVAAIGGATLVSRLLGFVRDIAVAGLFGAGLRADAFFLALQIVNLARRMLAEGALNAAFVPLYLKVRTAEGDQKARTFAGTIIGTTTTLLFVVALLLAVLMPAVIMLLAPGFTSADPRLALAIEWARLMLPYLVFAGPAALLMATLNANHKFAGAAWISATFNLVILFALACILIGRCGDSDISGRILAWSVGAAGFCQLALVAVMLWRSPYRIARPSISFGPASRDFVRLAVPGLIANALPQLTVISGVMAASSSPSAIAWLYYAQRLIELPLGVVGVAIGTVLVPTLSHTVHAGSADETRVTETRSFELSLALALPAAVALAVLSQPIVRTLFERGAFSSADTTATAIALAIFASGLPAHVMIKTWSSQFFARGDTKTPMLAGFVGLIIAAMGSFALMPLMGHAGVALAIAASGWIGALMLAILIHRRIGFSLIPGTAMRLGLIALAAALMGMAVAACAWLLGSWLTTETPLVARLIMLASLVVIGIGVYTGFLAAFRLLRPSDVKTALRRP